MNGPVVLTILRMLLSVVFFVFILLGKTWSSVAALIIFIIASLTDHIDGKWARSKNLVTDLGAFLDPLADKMLVNLALLALTSLNIIPIWTLAIILVRDFAVDGMRMAAAREGKTISASIYGKLKTTFQMIAIIVLLLNMTLNLEPLKLIGNILFYFALLLTIFSGFDYLRRGRKLIIKH